MSKPAPQLVVWYDTAEQNLNEGRHETCSDAGWAADITGDGGGEILTSKHRWSVSKQTNNYRCRLGFIKHHRKIK